MILDIIDMCAYCHEEHSKDDPEVIIARVKSDWSIHMETELSNFLLSNKLWTSLVLGCLWLENKCEIHKKLIKLINNTAQIVYS